MGLHEDLTGKRFFMVEVLERHGSDTFGNPLYKCICDCGKEFYRVSQHIRDKKVKSCGCLRSMGVRRGDASPNWRGIGDLSSSFVAHIKSHARHRKIEFNLSKEYLWRLFTSQNKICILSGIPLELAVQGNNYYTIGNASLDRIDSSKGYVEGNVQWVHKDVNFMKQQYSQEYFIGMCEKIYKYSQKVKE
jgi:hypothetical protein